jgi:hypothetical protein
LRRILLRRMNVFVTVALADLHKELEWDKKRGVYACPNGKGMRTGGSITGNHARLYAGRWWHQPRRLGALQHGCRRDGSRPAGEPIVNFRNTVWQWSRASSRDAEPTIPVAASSRNAKVPH